MESELDLFSKTIQGIHFWERVRFTIFQEILKEKGIFGQAHLKSNKSILLKFVFLSIKNILFKNPYLSNRVDLLFVGASRRKLLSDGLYWDIYCDEIIKEIKKSYLYLEFPYVSSHFPNPKTKKLVYYDFPVIVSRFVSSFFTRFNLNPRDREMLFQLRLSIKKNLAVDISVEKIIKNSLSIRLGAYPFYFTLLKKIRPKLVVVVCSYGKETFIEACKQLKIPVVELQHGTITPMHIAYSYPGIHRVKYCFPDYLFAWGDFWKEGTVFPISKNRIFAVGYPFLEQQVKKFSNKKLNQILFISQGTIGSSLSKFAVELSMKCKLDYKVVYKLHPGEFGRWKTDYPWLNGSNVKVIADDRTSLYQLFSQSKVQVGVYSTALYEGLYFKLKTYLVSLPGVESMDYLIRHKYATLVSSVNDLLSALKKDESTPCIDSDFFFKPNSIINICNLINDMIENAK